MKGDKLAAFIVTSGILLILVIKTFIRPYWLNAPSEIKFIMGIFPNLAGSFLLILGIAMFEEALFIFFNRSMLMLYSAACFAALVTNEYLQNIPLFMRTFDYFDIAASVIGITTGYFITRRFFMKEITLQSSFGENNFKEA